MEAYKRHLDILVDSQLDGSPDQDNCPVDHRILVDLVLDIVVVDTLIGQLVAELFCIWKGKSMLVEAQIV